MGYAKHDGESSQSPEWDLQLDTIHNQLKSHVSDVELAKRPRVLNSTFGTIWRVTSISYVARIAIRMVGSCRISKRAV